MSFIQTFLGAMTVFIPAIAGIMTLAFCFLIWSGKRKYAQGRLYNVSQIEFDSQMHFLRWAIFAIAGGAVVFTAGAYYLQAFYSKF